MLNYNIYNKYYKIVCIFAVSKQTNMKRGKITKKLHEAVLEWKEWIAKGINAKIVWHHRTQSYMVVFIFYPQVKGWYELAC